MIEECSDIKIERTFDTQLVRSVFSDKRLRMRIEGVSVDDFDPANQPDLYYLSCSKSDEVIGIILFHAFNSPHCCQGHVNYLPKYWGEDLHECTKLAIRWMFDNTDIIKIVALIPDFYAVVLKHAIAAGMRKEGYIERSVIVNGKPDNMTLVGIDRWM